MKSIKTNQLYQLTKVHFLETLREPAVLFWGIVFPVLISIGLGLAFTQASESKFNVVITGENHNYLDSLFSIYAKPFSQSGKQNILSWKYSDKTIGNTEFIFQYGATSTAIILLKRGEADLLIEDSSGKIDYHFDPHNSQAQLAYMKLVALLAAPANIVETEQSNVIPLTLKGVRYIDFLVPGLMTFGIMSSLLWGLSYTIIERRSQKLLRRMVATPMKKSCLLIVMMLVRIAMNIVECLILFASMWFIFDIRIQGSISALFALFLAGNIAFTGLSVLISSRTSNTEVGTGLINAIQMPMMLLSGIFFSYHNFPQWSIGVIKLLPLTALTDGIRSIFNEGAGWLEILPPSIALSAFGFICFTAGMRLFKWY